jgi:hypothetical protein
LNRDVLFTDGAKHVADHGGAYWLLDIIALEQRFNSAMAAEEFQVWTLKVDLDRQTGVVTCGNGDGFILFEKPIACTDFPIPEITLWFENRTIYLPSER